MDEDAVSRDVGGEGTPKRRGNSLALIGKSKRKKKN
jgi:hypothetical protein